jgi:S-formylglutathione hydrolase FrmB
MHAKLDQLRIPHVYDDYGPGVHDWPYWARDLERTLINVARSSRRRGTRPWAGRCRLC